jgi:hypothetical protein
MEDIPSIFLAYHIKPTPIMVKIVHTIKPAINPLIVSFVLK